MNNIFGEDDLPQEPDKYYEALVGPNAKFKDNESLAKGKWHADHALSVKEKAFDELSREYLKLKADHEAQASLRELIDQMNAPKEQREFTPNANPQPGIDPKDVSNLVKQEFSAQQRQMKAEENIKRSRELAREALGSNWQSTLKNRMDDLEIDEEEALALMRKPKVFASTFGLETKDKQPNFQSPPTSNQRSMFAPSTPKTTGRTWSHYQELKKNNPQAWLDPKVQTQMYKDAQELGEAFADGDFGGINPSLVRGI